MPELTPADNPAARLHVVLSRLRAQPKSNPLHTSWDRVFGLADDAPWHETYACLSQVAILPAQTVARLKSHPDVNEAPHFMDWHEPVLAVMSQTSLANSTEHASQHLTDAVLTSLSFAGWVLGRDGRRLPSEEQLDELVVALNEFEQQVMAGDLLPDLRLYLLEHIQQMRVAVRLVQVKGGDGLREAAERGMGGAVLWAYEQGRTPLVDRLWEVAIKIATVAQLATTGVAISAAGFPALPGV